MMIIIARNYRSCKQEITWLLKLLQF